jgi:hypothetical protein
MRRHPLTIVSVLGAVYVFYTLRGLGRALAAVVMGLPVNRVMLYKVLPSFDVFSDAWQTAPSRLATLILAGPACALLAGYLLLMFIGCLGKRLPPQLMLFLCMTSYAGLILDPIYYAVVPLLRLGGEPETLAWVLDASRLWVALPAMALLGLNVMLTRKRLVPLIREG